MVEGIPRPGSGQGFGDLIGFSTDLQNTLDPFHKQHAGLTENFADARFDAPQEVVMRLKTIVSAHILESSQAQAPLPQHTRPHPPVEFSRKTV